MRGSCGIRRGIAVLAVIVFLVFLFYGCVYRISTSLYLQDVCESGRVMTAKRQRITAFDYCFADDCTDSEDDGSFQLKTKKKMHIKLKNLMFMNIFFSMVLFPILIFITSIRLFGRCLARLWHVIVYIHKKDGGEIPYGMLRMVI